MSPAQAMERSYAALRRMLREGALVSGARLEANRLAYEIGVSMTPVRDALNRLAGERLVDAGPGEGFHVPRLTEAGLRDLYEWNAALVSMAVRTARGPESPIVVPPFADPGERAAALFDALAACAPNREIAQALALVADRLHPYRLAEREVLADIPEELSELLEFDAGQQGAIRRYHLRRMRVVGDLLLARDQGPARL